MSSNITYNKWYYYIEITVALKHEQIFRNVSAQYRSSIGDRRCPRSLVGLDPDQDSKVGLWNISLNNMN